MRKRSFVSFIFIRLESSGHFLEIVRCAGVKKRFSSLGAASRAVLFRASQLFYFLGATVRAVLFRASRDQLTQLDRGRTESPARIIIFTANYFFIALLRAQKIIFLFRDHSNQSRCQFFPHKPEMRILNLPDQHRRSTLPKFRHRRLHRKQIMRQKHRQRRMVKP